MIVVKRVSPWLVVGCWFWWSLGFSLCSSRAYRQPGLVLVRGQRCPLKNTQWTNRTQWHRYTLRDELTGSFASYLFQVRNKTTFKIYVQSELTIFLVAVLVRICVAVLVTVCFGESCDVWRSLGFCCRLVQELLQLLLIQFACRGWIKIREGAKKEWMKERKNTFGTHSFCVFVILFNHPAASHGACKYIVKLDVYMKNNLATTEDFVI